MAAVLDRVHGEWVHGRRVRVLAERLAALVPPGSELLDVGCGDGQIGARIARLRPDIEVSGIEIAARPETAIPVREFDGVTIPMADASVGAVLLVDVLHHAKDPAALLGEAARVAGRAVILKDAAVVGPLDRSTLKFMDWIGNARHDVPLPYNFWTPGEWSEAIARLGLVAEERHERLRLYPAPLRPLFERRMNFIARLCPEEPSAPD